MSKIFIITQEEPFFIPKMVRYILSQNKPVQVVGATILKPHRKNKNMLHWLNERMKIYTIRELFIAGFAFFWARVLNFVNPKNSKHSVRSLFKKNNVNLVYTNDINSASFLKKLKEIKPDYIISISCPQLFDEELLKVPEKFCFNAHGTLLPRHRGVFGSFWTLFNEDKVAGSTLHTMELKLDAGKILWQKEFSISRDDTQYSIAFKTKRDMSKGIIDVLEKYENKDEIEALEETYNSTYNRAPNKAEGEEFHKKGYQVIRLKDLKYIFKISYD
jgi:folate-dependent phosphoribosylglycinamide formyltransferase PurN